MQMDAPSRHVDFDLVAALHQGQRAADKTFRRHVQNASSVTRAAHARVRDAQHVAHALLQELRSPARLLPTLGLPVMILAFFYLPFVHDSALDATLQTGGIVVLALTISYVYSLSVKIAQDRGNNIAANIDVERGDVDAALRQSDVVIEETFKSHAQWVALTPFTYSASVLHLGLSNPARIVQADLIRPRLPPVHSPVRTSRRIPPIGAQEKQAPRYFQCADYWSAMTNGTELETGMVIWFRRARVEINVSPRPVRELLQLDLPRTESTCRRASPTGNDLQKAAAWYRYLVPNITFSFNVTRSSVTRRSLPARRDRHAPKGPDLYRQSSSLARVRHTVAPVERVGLQHKWQLSCQESCQIRCPGSLSVIAAGVVWQPLERLASMTIY
jgi:hypothetical protein